MTSLRAILDASATAWGIGHGEIVSECQERRLVYARFCYCLLARQLTRYSYPRIATPIARDHTTVIYAVRRAEALQKVDPGFADKILEIRSRLANYDDNRPRWRASRNGRLVLV